jgi:hypothetical protein
MGRAVARVYQKQVDMAVVLPFDAVFGLLHHLLFESPNGSSQLIMSKAGRVYALAAQTIGRTRSTSRRSVSPEPTHIIAVAYSSSVG